MELFESSVGNFEKWNLSLEKSVQFFTSQIRLQTQFARLRVFFGQNRLKFRISSECRAGIIPGRQFEEF